MFPMMLVLSSACTLAPHAYYSMQLPPIHLLFALLTSSPVDQYPIYAPFNCTMGLDTCAPPLTFWAHGSLLSSCTHPAA